jgi:hypothetical protein
MATAMLYAATAAAQVTPAAGFVPPNDTQALRVGMTVFLDNTTVLGPKGRDADCVTVGAACTENFTPNAFNVGRTYLNVTGTLSHIVSYRITPDIFQTAGTGGSYVLRIKYGYAQFSLDDWITNSTGNWIRFGQQQTPWIDFEEGIWRYRFQGTVFPERSGGYLSSSDRGASFHYNFPSNWGDLHTGLYNGETYSSNEVNQGKAWMTRVSFRPFARMDPMYRGLRVSVFYDNDRYQSAAELPSGTTQTGSAERTRLLGGVTFEHANLNAAFYYMTAKDQTTTLGAAPLPFVREGKGYSVWAVPKQGAGNVGWEGILRYDHLVPDTRSTVIPVTVAGSNPGNVTFEQQERNRFIAGIAYWLPHPAGNGTAAILFDVDVLTTGPGVPNATGGIIGVSGVGSATPGQANPSFAASAPFLPTPTLKTFSVHVLLNF